MHNKYFICPYCKKETQNDIDLIHKHVKLHSERILDQVTIKLMDESANWVEKE
jgi:hypothetical protein